MDCHVYVRCAARDGTRANDARDPIRSGLRRGSMLHASAELSVPRPAVTRVYKLKGISGNDERAKIAARGRSGPLARGPPRRRVPGSRDQPAKARPTAHVKTLAIRHTVDFVLRRSRTGYVRAVGFRGFRRASRLTCNL